MVAPQSRLWRPLPPSIERQQFCSAKSQASGEGNKTNTATLFPLSLVFQCKGSTRRSLCALSVKEGIVLCLFALQFLCAVFCCFLQPYVSLCSKVFFFLLKITVLIVLLSSPWFGSKLQSKELQERLIKLQEIADQKAYKELVKDITQHDHDEERVYFSSYREQLGFGEFNSHCCDVLTQSYLCCPI